MDNNKNNDLKELNDILFDTLRGVKTGTTDTKQANAVIGLSNALINNAKVQLNAFKLAGAKRPPDFFSLPAEEQKTLANSSKDKHELMTQFAIDSGYDNVAHGISAMGKEKFKKAFQEWID